MEMNTTICRSVVIPTAKKEIAQISCSRNFFFFITRAALDTPVTMATFMALAKNADIWIIILIVIQVVFIIKHALGSVKIIYLPIHSTGTVTI